MYVQLTLSFILVLFVYSRADVSPVGNNQCNVTCDDGSCQNKNGSCQVNNCAADEFQCKETAYCLPIEWKCDIQEDCPSTFTGVWDPSDEQCHSYKVKCPEHQFDCNGQECIEAGKVCDGMFDCRNEVDEGTFCFLLASYPCETTQCKEGCALLPSGLVCLCPSGFISQGGKCVDDDECKKEGSCDQLCTNSIGSFECGCVAGYTANHTHCNAINDPAGSPAILFASSGSKLISFSLDGKEITTHDLNNDIVYFDMIHRNNTICALLKSKSQAYNDTSGRQLKCFKADNFSESWTLPPSLHFTPDDVVAFNYDWVSGNWYFLDQEREMITVCRGDMSVCVPVVETPRAEPISMAFDPLHGLMFFATIFSTRLGDSAIESCTMDGKNRTKIVTNNVHQPMGLTIDPVLKHLYWIDSYFDFINRINYDGSNRRVVSLFRKMEYRVDLSLFQNDLIIAVNDHFTKVNKFQRLKNTAIDSSGRYNISRLLVYHRQKQPLVEHPCGTQNGGCEGVCIPMYRHGAPYPQCLCGVGKRLAGGACAPIPLPTELLILHSETPRIVFLPLKFPRAEPFMEVLQIKKPLFTLVDSQRGHVYIAEGHLNKTLIHRLTLKTFKEIELVLELPDSIVKAVIDTRDMNIFWTSFDFLGVTSMKNSSLTRKLYKGHFCSLYLDQQNSLIYWGEWVKFYVRIERARLDGSHREHIVNTEAGCYGGFTLKDSVIYWADYLNIKQYDMNTKKLSTIFSTEVSRCGLTVVGSYVYWMNYSRGLYRVPISANATTNKELVFDDITERFHDLHTFCPTLAFYNASETPITGACTKNNGGCPELCLSTPDGATCKCRDYLIMNGSHCVSGVIYALSETCPDNLYKCLNNRCILPSLKCDGHNDCEDGSDEAQCESSKGPPCLDGSFRCNDSAMCISHSWVCDGAPDCPDGSDERDVLCANVTCGPHEHMCQDSKRCIPEAWTCDGHHDCGENDHSDEGELCNRTSCSADQFMCGSGICLRISYVCDGDVDCKDGSDEAGCEVTCDSSTEWTCVGDVTCLPLSVRCDGYYNCTDNSDEENCDIALYGQNNPHKTHVTHICEPSEFKCADNLECIRKEFVCDGRQDCYDRSDEFNCTTNCTGKNCSDATINSTPLCEYPSRLCDNNTVCVHVEDLCDERANCQDGSDEGHHCDDQLCGFLHICSHFCHNAPDGIVCYCPAGMHLMPNSTECSDPCDAWGACSQVCQVNNHRPKCSCVPGYQLETDHYTCKSTDSAQPLLIFSNRHELRGVNLDSHNFTAKALIFSLKNTIALDFYHGPAIDMIYWTDVIDDKIYRGSLIGGSLSNIEVVVQTGLSTAEGLAVDWIGGNLYWVESNLDQIEVAKLNGSYRRTLIAGQMESPRAIALDPRVGLVFWTDWDANSPRIERCSMAGGHRKLVVRVDQLTDGAWPNGLTLDYVPKRIYWIDARSDSIHTTTYDGNDHHEVMRGHETLSHPFAIALFENLVYWTDWRTNSVIRANKWNGTQLRVIQRTLTQPFDIQIMHPSRQPRDSKKKNPCEVNNGGCSHLCLIDIDQGFQCNCPHVMRLDSDNKTCLVVNERILVFARANEVRGVDLEMPYFHTIPTISAPQVLGPSALDFHATRSRLYWSDPQNNEVKSSSLQGGRTETLIDTGIVHPVGLAVDWISGNLFVSASGANGNHISVSNLQGEYIKMVVNASDLSHLTSLALDPVGAWLFWSGERSDGAGQGVIERSCMDGSSRVTLVTYRDSKQLDKPQSLVFDAQSQRIFWVSEGSKTIQSVRADASGPNIHVDTLVVPGHPFALVPYSAYIYYTDHNDHAIHRIDQVNGSNNIILRNNTGNLLAMRIYDPQLQNITSNACTTNAEKCQHLCLPISEIDRFCACATGYFQDPKNHTRCFGVPELILYSVRWELKGIALDGKKEGQQPALGPLSRVAMASHLASFASHDLVLWADSDQGRLTRIHRDGTGRSLILDRPEPIETAGDLIGGLAIDWVAGNVYWTDPKTSVVEVARLNGTERYVVVPEGQGRKPGPIVVDPLAGRMFWVMNGPKSGVMTAQLDGSHPRGLFALHSGAISDISLDTENQVLYWCEANQKQIGSIKYDGNDQKIVLNTTLDSPLALVVHDKHLYWIDSVKNHGSIRKAPLHDLTEQTSILQDIGEGLKDIEIFSAAREVGENSCKNHRCAGLCLFNGTHPICACAHGQIGSDGVSCVEYKEFLMYSRVTQIDSIHMTDSSNLNAPFPLIEHRDLMRNAIGLSYDYQRSLLFYSDIQRGSINAVHFNGTNHTVLVERQGSVEGIAYDSYDNSLYWTCNNYATISRTFLNKRIQNNTKNEIEIVVKLFRDDKPRGIVVDPCHSLIFWTNWNTHAPSIQRSFINGFAMRSIVTTNIKMPNAITLDFHTMKLYWGDARLDKIERCDTDGKNRVVLTGLSPQHPFDMAVFGDYLFWTDWVLHAVIRANKHTGEEVQYLRKDVPRLMGIVAVQDDLSKCSANPCENVQGGCQDHCEVNEHGGAQCSCNSGRVVDPKNPTRCITMSEIFGNTTLFHCSSGSLIPFELTCDGLPHCEDGSDESVPYCAERTCIEGYHQCPNGRCINSSAVCDNINDCGDMSDEFNCACDPNTHFQCSDGKCYNKSFKCDFDPDCSDNSDEMNCPGRNCDEMNQNLFPGAEIVQFINCNFTTACIHPKWICDGQNDCWDNSDELNCPPSTTTEIKCRANQFPCKDGPCVPFTWACDREADCDDGSDELHCPEAGCLASQFRCNSSECVPITWRCDLTPDCTDGSDELVADCGKTVCRNSDFRCNKTGRCIPATWVCDGEEDCSDKSDEHESKCPSLKEPCLVDDDFQCLNGRCISRALYCDGDDDCGDKSDEPGSCERQPRCSPQQFQCQVGACIATTQVCDGVIDCPDNSDEDLVHCSGGITCNATDHFHCRNGICITQNITCNGRDDCGDFSDETLCNIDECRLGGACPQTQICIDKKVGYECQCPVGLKADEKDEKKCVDIDECQSHDMCSHFCWNTHGSFHCFCPKNYTLKPDKRSCKANSSFEPQLIYTNRYYIRELEYRTNRSGLLEHNLTNAVGLDYDWQEQCLYWSDVAALGSSIRRSCRHSNVSHEILHSHTVQNPDGIAVDWVGRNLYWCDKGLDTIEVSKLDGRFRRVLINENLMEPRAITLNPLEGAMYWTDWGDTPYVGKASMNGSNFRIIVKEALAWPNALTISYETKELFYADAKEDYIAVTDLEGKNRRILISRSLDPDTSLHHIFAMTVFEDYIFWTDWELKSVVKCKKFGKKECQVISKLVHRPMDVQVYHPLRQLQPEVNSCENNGGCSTLCLLTEGEKSHASHVCACPDNFILGPDGKGCVANCSAAKFVCESSYKCIPYWWKCDTQNDCGDMSDEPEHCGNFSCRPGEFQCDNSTCLHPAQICNGFSDCKDLMDESGCNNYECLASHFKCSGNATIEAKCILGHQRCDGQVDCKVGQEDEANCSPVPCQGNDHFACKDGSCIPSVWVCDKGNDCVDGSDEGELCLNRNCSADHFKCAGGQCIPQAWKCDGDVDCQDGDDEPASCADPNMHSCQPTYFKCDNFKCIPGRWQCDYANDCGDNSDEIGCKMRNCSESEFRCVNTGKCIPGSQRCDGRFHCADQTDEHLCSVSCTPEEFECKLPKRCIHREFRCDGESDCLDSSDERNCSTSCRPDQFTCKNKDCIQASWVCDGEDDCSDGSDETKEECQRTRCPRWKYRCSDHKCIPKSALCDGFSDCSDNADETNEVCWSEWRCGQNEIRCNGPGECISDSLACDGYENCGDGSDESDCDRQIISTCQLARNCSSLKTCAFGLCSQRCVEKKGHFHCQCASGYTLTQNVEKRGKKPTPIEKAGGRPVQDGYSCSAIGEKPMLVLAAEADLHIMGLYSPRDIKVVNNGANVKTQSIDFYHSDSGTTLFFVDHLHKKILSVVLEKSDWMTAKLKRSVDESNLVEEAIPTITRLRREVTSLSTALSEPRALAVDYITRRLYVIDKEKDTPSASIVVMTFEGRKKTTLIQNIKDAWDIVVDPESGVLVFSDRNLEMPVIEKSALDGTHRSRLVQKDLVWPTGLAIDAPAGRLYFADGKRRTVESVSLDGEKRFLIKKMDRPGHMPSKLDVFEDSVLVSMYHSDMVMRLNKFGLNTKDGATHNMQMLVTDVLIMQSAKQASGPTDPCSSAPCHDSALCVMGPFVGGLPQHRCLCPDGLDLTDSRNGSSPIVCKFTPKRCTLACQHGSCELTASGPKCICDASFYGELCNKYNCSQYCFNGGVCSIGRLVKGHAGVMRCHCPPEFTGERCETGIQCPMKCLNHGLCQVTPGSPARCVCAPGFTGSRCENCIDFFCENGGICTKTKTGDECLCQRGFRGPKCEMSVCANYCAAGNCTVVDGAPQCQCPLDRAGSKCDRDACQGYCEMGGTCTISDNQLVCHCPPTRTGPRCSLTRKCGRDYCRNGGSCINTGLDSQCKCVDGWGGQFCEEAHTCSNNYEYCFNGGSCLLEGFKTPRCVCPDGFFGKRCESSQAEVGGESDPEPDTSLGVTAGALIAVCIFLFVLVAIAAAYFLAARFRRGNSFSHVRMSENVEVNNPMYLRGGEELDESEDLPVPTTSDRNPNTFANPVYETLYNGGEEKKNLLSPAAEEPLPLDNDCV